jgi:hypothetical protein
MARIRLELEELGNKEAEMEAELMKALNRAVEKRIELVEIILGPGPESDQAKKYVLGLLARPEVKKLFYRVEKGDKNSGRLFVYFRHVNLSAYH